MSKDNNLITQPGFQDLLTAKTVKQHDSKTARQQDSKTRQHNSKQSSAQDSKTARKYKDKRSRLNLTNFSDEYKKLLAIAARKRDQAIVRLLEEIVGEWLLKEGELDE